MFVYSWKKTVKVLNPGIMFSVSFLPVQQSNMILQFLIRNSHTHQKGLLDGIFLSLHALFFFLLLIIRDTNDSDTNATILFLKLRYLMNWDSKIQFRQSLSPPCSLDSW